MASKIIILEQTSTAPLGFRYALWAAVPTARQPFYANATASSAWKNALPADITALQNGSVVETVHTQQWAVGTTLATIQTALISDFTQVQSDVTGGNNWNRYGTTWDGTTWVAGGVA